MGGQRSLRSYWRNYYERTDALIWVVDSADTGRMLDCRAELQTLLKEEKLAGAALLIFANKQDLPSALSPEEITKVRTLRLACWGPHLLQAAHPALLPAAPSATRVALCTNMLWQREQLYHVGVTGQAGPMSGAREQQGKRVML